MARKATNVDPHDDSEEPLDYRGRTRERAKRLDRTKTRVKSGGTVSADARQGIVISPIGPKWLVNAGDEFWVASVSGIVDAPEGTTLVAVGDRVWFVPEVEATEHGDRAGTIVKVEERTTVLSRKAAGLQQREQVLVANVEQLGIVMAAVLPGYNKRLIDRYLIAADKGDLRPFIVINKCDLLTDEDREDILDDLRTYWDLLHIPVIMVSARSNEGLEELGEALADTSTLLAGPSGVGKSSLINALTDSRQRVGEISTKYLKGKHTTTSSLVIPLPSGGMVVDSPGIREFGIFELGKEELPFYFEEFTEFASDCRFTPCSHTHEPGCAVKQAVEDGMIDEERYVSYLNLMHDISS